MLFQNVFVPFGTFFMITSNKKVTYETKSKSKIYFSNSQNILDFFFLLCFFTDSYE